MVTRRSVLIIGSTATIASLSGCNALSNSTTDEDSDPDQTDTQDGSDGSDTDQDRNTEQELCTGTIEETVELQSFGSRTEYSFTVPEGESYSISCSANGVQSFNIQVLHDGAQVVSRTEQLSYEREHTVSESQEVTIQIVNSAEIREVTNEIQKDVSLDQQQEATFTLDAVGRLTVESDIEEIMTLYGPDGRQVTTSALGSIISLVYETGEYSVEFTESVSGSVSITLQELDARQGAVEVSGEYTTVCSDTES